MSSKQNGKTKDWRGFANETYLVDHPWLHRCRTWCCGGGTALVACVSILHTWFINTRLYKNNLESYVTHRAMTLRTKRRVMLTVTLLMAFGFTMMLLKGLYIPCGILAGVWVFHILYFIFGVKTLEEPTV